MGEDQQTLWNSRQHIPMVSHCAFTRLDKPWKHIERRMQHIAHNGRTREHGILGTFSTYPELVCLGNSRLTYSFLNSEHVTRRLVIRPFFQHRDPFPPLCFNNVLSQICTLPEDIYVTAGLPHHVLVHPTHFSIRENELFCHNSFVMSIIIMGYPSSYILLSFPMTSYSLKDEDS